MLSAKSFSEQFTHTKKYLKNEQVGDTTDYNQEFLNYGSTLIQNKTHCKKYYQNLPLLQDTIDKYMVCTLAAGNIDDKGDQIVTMKPVADGCSEADKKAGRVSITNTHIA